MSDSKQFEFQKNIRDSHNAEEMSFVYREINKWGQEMKNKEKNMQSDAGSEVISPGVRSNVSEENCKVKTKTKRPDVQTTKIAESSAPGKSTRDVANEWKDKGNSKVKLAEYDQAIYCYTEAILHYNCDPIYYTNRALCYLKLEKYNQCIEDCNRAIQLDPSTVKAFYRKMQANESLGENREAFTNCKQLLDVDPRNVEAKKSLERLKEKVTREQEIVKNAKEEYISPVWTKLEENNKEIKLFIKSPHFRSKKPLKRIQVEDILEKTEKSTADKDIKNVKNNSKVIKDGSLEEMKYVAQASNGNKEVKNLNREKPAQYHTRKIENDVTPPTSSNQFYSTWKELSIEQKFQYFKSIETKNLNEILGACFDHEMLSEILFLLKEFYIKNNLSVLETLTEISKHKQVHILSLFLSSNDREAFQKLIDFIRETENDEEKVQDLLSKFDFEENL